MLLAGGLLWFGSTAGDRNAADERDFVSQLGEYQATIQKYTEEARAFADSAARLSRITFGLRRAGERGFAIQANEDMIRLYQDIRRSAERSRDSWQRILDISLSTGRRDLMRRARRREVASSVALLGAVLALGSMLILTWRWFGTRAKHEAGVAA